MTTILDAPAQIEENLAEFFRRVAGAQLGGRFAETPGLRLISTGIDNPLFNVALLSQPVDESQDAFHALLDSAGSFFGAQQLRYSLWFSHHRLSETARRRFPAWLTARGFRPSSRLVGMVSTRLADWPPRRPSLEIRPVADAEDLDAFCRITAESFRFPLFWCRALYGAKQLWRDGFACYLATFEEQPVSAMAVLLTGSAAGVYCVGTLPEFRRRGFAHALVRAVVGETCARHGISSSLLQCAPFLAAMYRKLGYAEVSRLDSYIC